MKKVFPKKWLGQHFLNDEQIAYEITSSLPAYSENVLEIGPGMGILSSFLFQKNYTLKLIEIDSESLCFLKNKFEGKENHFIQGDFLKIDITQIFDRPFCIIGNFPYNISSQILFKMLENKHMVTHLVGMFQKEVAERICGCKGKRTYGILSVFVQAYYNTEYLMTVPSHVFNPPPKVESAVIRLTRKENFILNCNEIEFFRLVKKAFNQRRKKLRNALKEYSFDNTVEESFFQKRAEELSVDDFIHLTNGIIKI